MIGESTTTLDGLLAAVRAAPEDDTVRMILADHLDEQAGGYDPRGEFIRVQIRRAALKRQVEKAGLKEVRSILSEREVGLWSENVDRWFPFAEYGHVLLSPPNETTEQRNGHTVSVLQRGFVGEVYGTLATLYGGECERCGGSGRVETYEYDPIDESYVTIECDDCNRGTTLGILPSIVRREPVQVVRVTDKEPVQGPLSHGWHWYSRGSGSGFLPTELMADHPEQVMGDLAMRHESQQEALDWLSRRLLRWAGGVK